jgi:hypothetical protein
MVTAVLRERLGKVGNHKGPKRIRWDVEKLQHPEVVMR